MVRSTFFKLNKYPEEGWLLPQILTARKGKTRFTGNYITCKSPGFYILTDVFSYADGEWPAVFPFHPECFDILTSVITGSTNTDLLDKDILYRVMADISSRTRLDLDYGAISGNEQFWDSIPGEEFSVKDPSDIPGVKGFLQDKLSSKSFKIPKWNLDLRRKVVKDPLGALPYDILHLICSYLPGQSVVLLITASIPVSLATANNQFWKQRIQRDMPWFWELQELIAESDYPDIDFRGLYLWLDKMTTPRFGMQGILIAIANRRRIWGVCEKIRGMYFSGCYWSSCMEDTSVARPTDYETPLNSGLFDSSSQIPSIEMNSFRIWIGRRVTPVNMMASVKPRKTRERTTPSCAYAGSIWYLWSRWNRVTCNGVVPRGDQPVRLNPTRLSHPDSSTYTRWYDLKSDRSCR